MSSKALSTLDLSHNRIVKTAFLQHLASLELLDVSHNFIIELELPTMPNLESLNLSHNEVDKLPSLAVCFPELVCLNLAHNSLCSEMELLSAVSEAQYLTELDFRENPMFTEAF
jgi:Leucine-rich repeat (LRR) protein